ncbi:1-hydroxycarotenoid 3,4-desaturase CrtD [Parasediminibacterium sp. JCM 36343]|uniref:1-hydroxycarotenoid 3,4-desaturase CrtD n=1 Tax=Parasediminibacterium sp. JCM 36343 TaxID=3374279 RepID=UPI00397B437E
MLNNLKPKTQNSKQKKAIIIGAGIAGLASAIRLAVMGFEVVVFEKNSYPGGKLSNFEKDGYHFDAGPSLFTQPENIEELFALAKEPIEDFFSYQPQPIACKYFYEDGTVINAYTNTDAFAKELEQKLGEDGTKLKAYLLQAAKTYNDIGSIFLNYSLHKFSTLLKAPIGKAVRAVKAAFLFKTLDQVNEAAFTKPQTVQLFNRYATYNGSNPYKAPGMLSLIPHLDHNIGTFYPKGGMISITNALHKLAVKKGVQFHFNTPVESITNDDSMVKGVVVNGAQHNADLVVSNMDVYFTFKHLLKDDKKATQLLKQERSSSAFIFYWGVNTTFPQLELHNIFFATDYKAEFEALFTTKTLHEDPTVYINITSKCEPGLQAPSGKENWFVMVNAPANIGQDWSAYQQSYRKAIINKLNRLLKTDIESLIEVEETLSPIDIETKTASYMGSLYGTSSNGKMAAFFRHPNFSNQIKGLYFVGGSVHPGGGIPLCLQSAKIMSEIVSELF